MAEVRCQVEGIANGFALEVHDHGDEFISTALAASGCWELFETEVVRRVLGSAIVAAAARGSEGGRPLFVDGGANLGWYSVVAGLLGADVIACEPMPANAALLRRNVMANELSERVVVHETALGDGAGVAQLHLSGTNQGDHRLHVGAAHDASKERASVPVPVCTLTSLLGGRRPAMIKLDTQGSEVAILRGGLAAWQRGAGSDGVTIVTEFWPYGLERCGSSADEFLAMIAPLLSTVVSPLGGASHRCFEIVEHSRALVPRTFDELVALANSRGLSNEVRGFVNLLFMPVLSVSAIEDLIEPVVLDVRGLGCGSVLVRLAAFRRTVTTTTTVIVWTDDIGAPEELPAWCRLTGQTYVGPADPVDGVEPAGRAEQFVLILSPLQPEEPS